MLKLLREFINQTGFAVQRDIEDWPKSLSGRTKKLIKLKKHKKTTHFSGYLLSLGLSSLWAAGRVYAYISKQVEGWSRSTNSKIAKSSFYILVIEMKELQDCREL